MESVIKFRRCLLEVTKDEETPKGIDVLWDATTIAGACMKIYKLKFLRDEHLVIVPEGGFEKNERQSAIAIKYFEWLEFKEEIEAQHAGNGPEKKVKIRYEDKDGRQKFKTLKLDCWIPEQRKIIEYQGCAYHGCMKCYKPNKIQANRKTAEENLYQTRRRMNDLRKYAEENDIVIEEIWGCELKEMLKEDKEMKKFFDEQPEKGPIDPRAAYFGGKKIFFD